MFKEERDQSQFDWSMLGPEGRRPNLGCELSGRKKRRHDTVITHRLNYCGVSRPSRGEGPAVGVPDDLPDNEVRRSSPYESVPAVARLPSVGRIARGDLESAHWRPVISIPQGVNRTFGILWKTQQIAAGI